MSNGKNIKYMDGKVYAGTRIISPGYFLGDVKSVEYQDHEARWVDMGSFDGLERAKKLYEKISNLSELRDTGQN